MLYKKIYKEIKLLQNLRLFFFSLCWVTLLPARQAFDVSQVLDDTAQMLEQVDPAMAAQMKQMTPEQQKELEQQLNVVFEKMNTMSPEELKELEMHPEKMFDFVEKTVASEQAPKQPAPAPTPPEPVKKIQTTPKPVAAPTVPKKEVIETAELLETIIKITEGLILKIETLTLDLEINRWATKNKIKNWQHAVTYKQFEEKLRAFAKTLRTFKEKRDPKTQALIHVQALAKNLPLLEKLQALHSVLVNQWPLITDQEKELDRLIKKINRETKSALRTMLGAYAKALETVPALVDATIKEYDPRALELQKEEQEAIERATKAEKLPAREMRDIGARPSYDAYSPYDYDYAPYSPYYQPNDYDSYYPQQAAVTSRPAGKSVKAPSEKNTKTEKDAKEKDADIKEVVPAAKKDRTAEILKSQIDYLDEKLKKAKDAIADLSKSALTDLKIGVATEKIRDAKNFYSDTMVFNMRLLTTEEKSKENKKIIALWEKHEKEFKQQARSLSAQVEKKDITQDTPEEAKKDPAFIKQPKEQEAQTSEVSGEDMRRLFGELPYAAPPLEQVKTVAHEPEITEAPKAQIKSPIQLLHKELEELIETFEKIKKEVKKKETDALIKKA